MDTSGITKLSGKLSASELVNKILENFLEFPRAFTNVKGAQKINGIVSNMTTVILRNMRFMGSWP